MKICGPLVVLVLGMLPALTANAQQSASQNFQVIVPTNVAIVAPPTQTITHDQTDGNQTFSKQRWTVKGNVPTGVNVSFATSSAFTHTTSSSQKRDAQLLLELAGTQGMAAWTVTKPADMTNYSAARENAVVNATSTGAGRANFDLTVTFVTGEYGSFAAGTYAMTVVGTVAAN